MVALVYTSVGAVKAPIYVWNVVVETAALALAGLT